MSSKRTTLSISWSSLVQQYITSIQLAHIIYTRVVQIIVRQKKNPLVLFRLILIFEVAFERVSYLVRSHRHTGQRSRSRETERPTKRAEHQRKREGEDRQTEGEEEIGCLVLPRYTLLYLSHSLILSSSCTVHSFEHLSRSISPYHAHPSMPRLSLSFCHVRTFIHLLSVLPAARVLSTHRSSFPLFTLCSPPLSQSLLPALDSLPSFSPSSFSSLRPSSSRSFTQSRNQPRRSHSLVAPPPTHIRTTDTSSVTIDLPGLQTF